MRRISDADHAKILREQVEQPPAGESPLHCFMRHCWHLVDPHPFSTGWHLQAKCEVLTHVHEGDIRDLILNEPPGSCKSMLTNVFWPAFQWLKVNKSQRFLFGSFDQSLVNRDAEKFLDLLGSPLVRTAFPEFSVGGLREKKAVQGFNNPHGGLRFGTTPGGTGTGWHFHGHVYDDLIKPASIVDGVSSDAQKSLNKAIVWVRETMANRAIDLEKLWRVVIAQRLHEADPSGQLLEDGDWEHLCFPEEYVPNAKWIVEGHQNLSAIYDKRTEPGELLWPERRSRAAVERIKKNMKKQSAHDAQNQQNPATDTGGILRLGDFEKHAYKERPPLEKCELVASLDLSFKKTSGNSRVAWSMWARYQEIDYWITGGAEQLDYAESKAKVLELLEDPLWGLCQVFLIEDKANGTAVLSDLEEIPKIEAFEPSGTDKLERMFPFIIPTRVGSVRFPSLDVWPEERAALEEICKVPRGQHDDLWDTMSQALTYMSTGLTNYSQALKQWRSLGMPGV